MLNLLLEDLKTSVIAGGKEIMKVYGKNDFNIWTKKDKSPVTEADKASHNAITRILGEQNYHGIPLIMEESDYHAAHGTYIAIDEMDGTGRFVKRQPGFMVLAQYVQEGKPTISTNYDPVNNNIYHAIAGQGSYVNGSKIESLDDSVRIDSAKVIINGRDKNTDYYGFMSDRFSNRLDAGLATGSRMAGILNGHYHAFVNNGSEHLHAWDLGMYLNLVEAGAVVTRKDGSDIDFNNPSTINDIVCSCNPKLHEEVLSYTSYFK